MTCIGSVRDADKDRPAPKLPYLIVPRDTADAAIRGFCQHATLDEMPADWQRALRPVRTEAERLRERVAALEAQLAAALAAAPPNAAQPMPQPGIRHGIAAWPGAGGVDQRTGKPRWV